VALLAADEPLPSGQGRPNGRSAKRATPILTHRVKQAIAEWYVLQMLELSWDGFCTHTEQGWNIGKPCYGHQADKIPHPVPAKWLFLNRVESIDSQHDRQRSGKAGRLAEELVEKGVVKPPCSTTPLGPLQPESDPADAVSPGAARAAAKQRSTHQDGQDPTFGGHEHGAVVAESERLRLSLQLEVAPNADSLLMAASVRRILMTHRSAISARMIGCHRSAWTAGCGVLHEEGDLDAVGGIELD
jgi:hypothetical protein